MLWSTLLQLMQPLVWEHVTSVQKEDERNSSPVPLFSDSPGVL